MATKEQGAKPTPKTQRKTHAAKAGKAAPAKKPPGRPTTYTDAIAAKICSALADGKSLRSVCEADDMPDKATVLRWLADEARAEFCDQYARARETQADLHAETMLEIADEEAEDATAVARNRLRVDTRKWLASKLAPKKYGDKITAEHTGKDGGAIQVASVVEFVIPPARGDDE